MFWYTTYVYGVRINFHYNDKNSDLFLRFPAGYIANATATVAATQLKQTVTIGQDLATYATYEAYPAFAVAARSDGYGAF